MRFFTFLFSVLVITSTFAQGGRSGGGGQRGQMNGGGQQRQQEEMPEFDAAQVAGIFSYDDVETVKKIKIKKDDDLKLRVRRAIAKYNTRMDEISLVNTENFDTLNVFMNTMRKQMRPNRNSGGNQAGPGQRDSSNSQARGRNSEDDNDPMREIMEATKQKIDFVKVEVLKEEELLNSEFESVLSEKQFKKWIKYQEKIKKENAPQEPSNNQNQGQGQGQGQGGGSRGGGQGGSQGGGGGNRF